MVDPKIMCRFHLLGEHRELHALAGMIQKGIGLEGYAQRGLIEIGVIRERHEALVREMEARGYRHISPLPEFSLEGVPAPILHTRVDREASECNLLKRCERCRKKSGEKNRNL